MYFDTSLVINTQCTTRTSSIWAKTWEVEVGKKLCRMAYNLLVKKFAILHACTNSYTVLLMVHCIKYNVWTFFC